MDLLILNDDFMIELEGLINIFENKLQFSKITVNYDSVEMYWSDDILGKVVYNFRRIKILFKKTHVISDNFWYIPNKNTNIIETIKWPNWRYRIKYHLYPEFELKYIINHYFFENYWKLKYTSANAERLEKGKFINIFFNWYDQFSPFNLFWETKNLPSEKNSSLNEISNKFNTNVNFIKNFFIYSDYYNSNKINYFKLVEQTFFQFFNNWKKILKIEKIDIYIDLWEKEYKTVLQNIIIKLAPETEWFLKKFELKYYIIKINNFLVNFVCNLIEKFINVNIKIIEKGKYFILREYLIEKKWNIPQDLIKNKDYKKLFINTEIKETIEIFKKNFYFKFYILQRETKTQDNYAMIKDLKNNNYFFEKIITDYYKNNYKLEEEISVEPSKYNRYTVKWKVWYNAYLRKGRRMVGLKPLLKSQYLNVNIGQDTIFLKKNIILETTCFKSDQPNFLKKTLKDLHEKYFIVETEVLEQKKNNEWYFDNLNIKKYLNFEKIGKIKEFLDNLKNSKLRKSFINYFLKNKIFDRSLYIILILIFIETNKELYLIFVRIPYFFFKKIYLQYLRLICLIFLIIIKIFKELKIKDNIFLYVKIEKENNFFQIKKKRKYILKLENILRDWWKEIIFEDYIYYSYLEEFLIKNSNYNLKNLKKEKMELKKKIELFLKYFLNLKILFFIKNKNNYEFHNLFYYYYYEYRSHEFLFRSIKLIRPFLQSLETIDLISIKIFSKYIKRLKIQSWKMLWNDFFLKKNKRKEPKRILRGGLNIVIFFQALEKLQFYISLWAYKLREDPFIEEIIDQGNIRTSSIFLHLLFDASSKEFSLRFDEMISNLLRFNLKFLKTEKKDTTLNLDRQKALNMQDYNLLTFLCERSKNQKLLLETNFFYFLEKKLYLFLLNNIYLYLIFFYNLKNYILLGIFFKFPIFYLNNIIYFILLLITNNSSKKIIMSYFLYFILNMLKNLLNIRKNLSLIFILIKIKQESKKKNKLKFIFFTFLKIYIFLNLLLFIFNINIYDIFLWLNSMGPTIFFNWFKYMYIFFIESIKYMIEEFFFKNILVIFCQTFLNYFYTHGIFLNFKDTDFVDYKFLIKIYKNTITMLEFTFDDLYTYFTWDKQDFLTKFNIPSHLIHGIFWLFLEHILNKIYSIYPLWLFFLNHWYFIRNNVFSGFMYLLWFPSIKLYFNFFNLFDFYNYIYFLIYFVLKFYFFLEFFFNKLDIFFIWLILKISNIIYVYILKIIIVLKYILILIIWGSIPVINILNYIYVYLFIFKLKEFIFILSYIIFLKKLFLNFFMFFFNFFLYYSEYFYNLFNIEFIIDFFWNDKDGKIPMSKHGSTFKQYGHNLTDNIWNSKNKLNNTELFFSLILFELKNLEYFKSNFAIDVELNPYSLIFFFVYVFFFLRLILFIFSIINKWFFFVFYNNENHMYFRPYIGWNFYDFWKKERAYHLNKKNKELDVPLLYLFGSYNYLDNYLYQRYNLLIEKNNKNNIFSGKVSKLEKFGKLEWINDGIKMQTKLYISNNKQKYPTEIYDTISKNLIKKKKNFYFSFFLKSYYFFKNYQIFWFRHLDDFLVNMLEMHGRHTFFELKKMYNFPLDLEIDKYNYLFVPKNIYIPFIEDDGEIFFLSQDFLLDNYWINFCKNKIYKREKKKLLKKSYSYNFSNFFIKKKEIKNSFIKYNLLKPNKTLYFDNYLNYPLLFFFFFNKEVEQKNFKYLNFLFPLNLKKNFNIYNKYFILNKILLDNLEDYIAFGPEFLMEFKNLEFLRKIFWNSGIQSMYLFNEYNYNSSWKAESKIENMILHSFFSDFRFTDSSYGIMEPSNYIIETEKNLYKSDVVFLKFFSWLQNINNLYFNNYFTVYKRSTNKFVVLSEDTTFFTMLGRNNFTENLSNELKENKSYLLNLLDKETFFDELKKLDSFEEKKKKEDINFEIEIENIFKSYNNKELEVIFASSNRLTYQYSQNMQNFGIFFIIIYLLSYFFLFERYEYLKVREWKTILPAIFSMFKYDPGSILIEALMFISGEPFEFNDFFFYDLFIYFIKFFNLTSYTDYQLPYRDVSFLTNFSHINNRLIAHDWFVETEIIFPDGSSIIVDNMFDDISRFNLGHYDARDWSHESWGPSPVYLAYQKNFKNLIMYKPKIKRNSMMNYLLDYNLAYYSYFWSLLRFEGIFKIEPLLREFLINISYLNQLPNFKSWIPKFYYVYCSKYAHFFFNVFRYNWLNFLENSHFLIRQDESRDLYFYFNKYSNRFFYFFFLSVKRSYINTLQDIGRIPYLNIFNFIGDYFSSLVDTEYSIDYNFYFSGDSWYKHKDLLYYFESKKKIPFNYCYFTPLHGYIDLVFFSSIDCYEYHNWKKSLFILSSNSKFFGILWFMDSFFSHEKYFNYIDQSYFLKNNKLNLWLFQLWLNNKTFFLYILEPKAENFLTAFLLIFIFYFFIYFFLFIIIFFIFIKIFMTNFTLKREAENLKDISKYKFFNVKKSLVSILKKKNKKFKKINDLNLVSYLYLNNCYFFSLSNLKNKEKSILKKKDLILNCKNIKLINKKKFLLNKNFNINNKILLNNIYYKKINTDIFFIIYIVNLNKILEINKILLKLNIFNNCKTLIKNISLKKKNKNYL